MKLIIDEQKNLKALVQSKRNIQYTYFFVDYLIME